MSYLSHGQTNLLQSQNHDVDVEDPITHEVDNLPTGPNLTSHLFSLTHNLHHRQPPLHHLEQHLDHYPQQGQGRQFHYRHQHYDVQHHPIRQQEQEVNIDVVDATSALQHDDAVIEVGLHCQAHPESIPPSTEQQHQHHYPRYHIPVSPSPLVHQRKDHQMNLSAAYIQRQYHHHQEQDRSLSSENSMTLSDEKKATVYIKRNSHMSLLSRRQLQVSEKYSVISNGNETGSSKNEKDIDSKKNTKRKQQQEIDGEYLAAVPASKKSRRRRYENDLKFEVLEQLKVPHSKLSDVAKRYSIPENTLRDWRKVNVANTIENARSINSGQLKANVYDPMRRLTETLISFFEHNKRQPKYLRQSITTKLVVAKGIEARNKLLKRHETHPYLDPKEKKALETFTGSDSWAKKFARRCDLKMTGARVKELSEEEINEYHKSLKKMDTRVRQAGICYEEVANLLRQSAEKLLCSSIIQSTAANRIMGDIVVSNSRNSKNMSHETKTQLQSTNVPSIGHYVDPHNTNQASLNLLSEQADLTHTVRNILNTKTAASIPDHSDIKSPSVRTKIGAETEEPSIAVVPTTTKFNVAYPS